MPSLQRGGGDGWHGRCSSPLPATGTWAAEFKVQRREKPEWDKKTSSPGSHRDFKGGNIEKPDSDQGRDRNQLQSDIPVMNPMASEDFKSQALGFMRVSMQVRSRQGLDQVHCMRRAPRTAPHQECPHS